MKLDRTIAPNNFPIDTISLTEVCSEAIGAGKKVFYLKSKIADVARIEWVYDAGHNEQDKLLQASMANRLMKATSSYAAYEFQQLLDTFGAFVQRSVVQDRAVITLYCLTKYLDELLPLLQELLQDAHFDDKEFALDLKQTRARYLVSTKKTAINADRKIRPLLFRDHAYGNELGLSDFDGVEMKDIIAFYTTNYKDAVPDIYVTGNFKETHIILLKEMYQDAAATLSQPIKYASATPNTKRLHVPMENTVQSAIRFVKHMPAKGGQGFHQVNFVNTILGGYFGSRLMQNIREDKGYTYGIGSYISSLRYGSYMVISTEVGKEVTFDAVREIKKELIRLSTDKVDPAEISLVKNYIIGKLLNRCDGVFGQMDVFKSLNYFGLTPSYFHEGLDVIKSIDAKMIQDMAVQHMSPESFVEVVAGDV